MPTLTIDWQDATVTAQRWTDLNGREFLNAISDGTIPLPPILSVLGIKEGALGDGWIEFSMVPAPYMLNLAGVVHGGVLATLVDSALTCALVTKLPKGLACTTIDLQIRFFRPARISSEKLTARAEVLNAGKSVGATQAWIRDAKERLIVHATSSLAIARVHDIVMER